MAAEVSADLNVIQDEDVLRRMWQQTDDFGKKKEIRQRMYKLREQRLKDFYTGDQDTMASRKHATSIHADSITDQGFMTLKSKEIRDSESPTRDIHRRQGENNYWNTVQHSTYNTEGDEGNLIQSYERTSTGTGRSEDGNTQSRLEADERGYMSTKTTEDGGAKTVSDQQSHDSHIATTSHTKGDGGQMYSSSTSKEHQENKSSVTESKNSSSTFKSTKWETSSSSSSRMVTSSTNRITSGTNDLLAITSGDDIDFTTSTNHEKDFDISTVRRGKNSSHQDSSKRYNTNEVQKSSIDNQVNSSTSLINSETRNNLRNRTQDNSAFVDIREDHFGGQESRRDSSSTYTSEVTSNIDDYTTSKDITSTNRVTKDIKQDVDRNNVVVDQKILTEIHKLDSFLSTQNTPGTNTPASPRSVIGDVNWTVVSNTDGEFVYKDDKGVSSPGPRTTPIKQPDSLDLPKDSTEGQYVTTYNEHYTSKRISMDVSPTHDKFARSLRQTPPGTPRSLSRQSLDRSSPERKSKSSPRSSPEKERRTSVGSYTIERPSSVRRKTSEVIRQTGTSTDSSLKSKRKFSTTQTKAAAKARSSTPGTSPSTSPSRKQRERSDSASSASDSDASQITYQKSTASSRIRADVVRKNLMESFDKEPHKTEMESSDTIKKISSRPSSPEKSPIRKSSTTIENKTSSILRKDSRTDSKSSISTMSNVIENKIPSGISPRVRDKSPEYSSEGSVGKEIKHSQTKTSPDSSPDRTAFTPIKQFRTSPERSSETIQVTANESDKIKINETTEFIEQEVLDAQRHVDTVHVDINISHKAPSPDSKVMPVKETYHPKKEPLERKSSTSKNVPKSRSSSPQKSRSPSPGKKSRDERIMKQKGSSPTRKQSQHDSKPQMPAQTNRKPSLSQRSPSPQKNQPKSPSSTKRISTTRKPSVSSRSPSPSNKTKSRSPSPTKTIQSRSPSPSKVETTLITTVTRKSSLKKDSTYKVPPSTRRSSRQQTPSPVKDNLKSRSPSPKKESPQRYSSSPSKSKSPSPQRTTNKRSSHQISSPSISPCSSPDRPTDRLPEKSKLGTHISGPKSPETVRTTKRTSIPRADQAKTVKKTVQTKIEITSTPASKIPSTISKGKQVQSPIRKAERTGSQSSLDRQINKKTYSTTIKRIVDKSKEPIKKTPITKKVTTTATISLHKPTNASQVKHVSSNTVSRITTYKRTSSKDNVPKTESSPSGKKPIATTTTKRIASRTNTPKSKPNTYVETNKSVVLSSPDTIMSRKGQTQQFIEQLKHEEETIHGFKGEIINIEIADNELDNDLENETRPELYPETEEDEDGDKQNVNYEAENTQHLTEKTINIDSKRKIASQFVVTVKKPTASTKAAAKPVTTRSSSGPVRGSPQNSVKPTMPVKTPSNTRQTTNVQKADSLNLLRTTSEKNISKNTAQKRQVSKPELTTPSHTTPKLTSTKHVTETGIASRNVTTAKSATIKRMPSKKKRTSSVSSSFSEEEDVDIPSVITPNQEEQEYIEELEEMRRKEEMEYASKLTATSNQENQLLSIIIQHPKSSRESSPDTSNRSQPFCAVSDDGGANPRYADLISEPEDVEVFDPKNKPKFQNFTEKQPRNEQVTDLDDESEAEELKLNVSVADRVTHFIETSNAHKAHVTREEPDSHVAIDNSQNVLKAKAMFETIANNQKAPPAPGNRPVDILSRPSIFEARRGQTAPKPVYSETILRTESLDDVQRHGSIQTEYQQNENVEVYESSDYDIHVDVKEVDSLQTKVPTSVEKSLVLEKRNSISTSKTYPLKKESIITTKTEASPKKDPSSRPAKKELTPLDDNKRPINDYKHKPFEKTISATAEISSKRAFFERKAQTQSTPTKETKTYSTVKERRPLTDSIQNKQNIRGPSPPRKTSQTTEFIQNERKSSRVSPERKPSTPSPVKERKPSLKSESPERKISLSKSVKERRSSFTKEDVITTQKNIVQKKDSFTNVPQARKISSPSESPERRAPITQKNFPDHVSTSEPTQKRSPSPVKDRKPSFTRESPDRTSQRKISRTSPDRAVKSPDRSFPENEQETVELKKAGKFGVTLRRTSSTTSASTPRRSSIPGETQEIEDVTDMALLEIMMEKAVGYEQRRRIRSQMRVVKKLQDDKTSRTTKQKSPTRSPIRDVKVNKESVTKITSTTYSKKPDDRRPSSPSKGKEKILERPASDRARPSSPSKAPEGRKQEPLYNGHTPTTRPLSPDRRSPTLRSSSPQSLPGRQSPQRQSQPGQSPLTNEYHRPEVETVRRSSKTDTTEISASTTVRSQKRTETLVESGVDCITSSYGVGPTDELGRPLFGLRALRRSNTNKQLTDDVEVRQEEPRLSKEEPVSDSRGRPLFGGLKALRAIETYEDSSEMPEQTSTQLRELVQHHEKVVRETNGPQDQPKQKPRAKLRDSFISTEDEPSSPGHLSEVNSLNRGFSLKSIIQKHENIASTGGVVRNEMESSHTVVTSRSVMASDGSVSLSRDVIQGEISAKNGEEPVGKVTRTQYTYQSPQGDDKGVNKVTTTTTALGGRRTSGPRITEIEDEPQRKSSLKTSNKRSSVTEVTEEVSGRKASERITNRRGSLRKSPSEDEDRKTDRRFSNQQDEENTQKVTSRVSSTQKFTTSDDSATNKRISSTTTRQTETRSTTSSPSLRRQKSSEEESTAEDKRKTVVRGDSVRALQHKFQQATENAVNSAPRNSSTRAGLILRTSSFTNADQQESVSSTLKQSTNLSAEKRNGRQSPDKSRREATDVTSRKGSLSDAISTRRDSLTKTSSDVTSRRESMTKDSTSSTTSSRVVETHQTSSFLDNTSRVTGVQDILTRMRNADLVNESGDTDADREARALLNKFLGASVILQGMEQGMRSAGIPSDAVQDSPVGSAALVRSVEKQRVATTRQKEEDIENIWDEQVLKSLLERCTDYEGRRKLRARLRTVMAEHKACADLVAVTGDNGANSSHREESETKQVTTKTDGGSVTRTEVHTRTSTNRLTKASSVSSPFAKFRQLERQNSAPSVGQATPLFKITDPRVARSASSIKDRLLSWVQAQTREYKNIQIDNFSTSWNNGLAFCALIHHFCPEAFDYDKLIPEQRRHNFELAFRVAEEEAGIAPLLDVEDMVVMRRPDWKCVFTYVQSVYRRFHSTPEAVRC